MQVLYLSDASWIHFHAELENKECAMEPACFASAWSSGEMCLAFRFLSLKPECGFKFCLGVWLMALDCIRHGSVVSYGGWNHRNCLDSYSWPVDKLTVSCLYKAKYWYWHNKHCNELWSDWGLPLSTQCFGHEHTHTHRLVWDSLLASRGSWTLTDWLVFFHPGKLMDDVCLV